MYVCMYSALNYVYIYYSTHTHLHTHKHNTHETSAHTQSTFLRVF